MKNYNLIGGDLAGQTLVGNWAEDRVWKEDKKALMRSSHGEELLTCGNKDMSRMISETHDKYRAHLHRGSTIPPRQKLRERQAAEEIFKTIQEEQLSTEDHSMYFTRGRYLEKAPEYEEIELTYYKDNPITMYSENGMQRGKNSEFTKPIEHYLGREKVKDL